MADYVFYRTFDVRQCKIMDELPEEISQTDSMWLSCLLLLLRFGLNLI